MRIPEKAIVQHIINWLTIHGFYVWKQNNHATFDRKRGVWRKGTQKRGVSDILGVVPGGRILAIEVKAKGGKVSDDQEKFLDAIASAGGVAFVAYSLDEVQKQFKILGLI